MADLFDMTQDDKGLALAGLLLGMGQGFSQAGAQGGSFLSGLGNAGGAGFRNMLGFQQSANQDALRKFQIQKMKREMEQDEAIRRGMTEGGTPPQQVATPAPSSPEGLFGAAAPVVPVERAELPADLFGLAQTGGGSPSPSARRAEPGDEPVLLGPGDRRPAAPTIGGGEPAMLPSMRLPPARGTAPPAVLEGQFGAVPAIDNGASAGVGMVPAIDRSPSLRAQTPPPGPLPGQQSPTAPQPPQPPNAPPQQARANVPPLLQGLPPDIAEQVQRIARVDPKGGYKMLLDFTGEMLKAGRWEIVPHPQDPNTLISVDKYGMRPPVALPPSFARDMALRQAGATRVNVDQRIDQAGGVKLAELGAKALTETYERVPIVQSQLGSLDLMEKALESYKTGFAGETGLQVKQALEAAGVRTNAKEGEFFRSLSIAAQVTDIPKGQGSVTENERAMFAKAAPNLSTTREGNQLIIEAKRAMLQREAQAAAIMQEEVERNRDNLGTAYLNFGRRVQQLGPTFSPQIMAKLRDAAETRNGGGGEPAAAAPSGVTRWGRDAQGNPVPMR